MPKKVKPGWYVLYVRSCQEKKVHNLLVEKQVNAFLPMFKTIKQWSDRKKAISKPLFPSYIFVEVHSNEDFYKALSVEGACVYICFGKEYAMVREEEITKIKLLVAATDIADFEVNATNLKEGDVKTILYGPLSGLECEVLKINNTNKIIVRIESLQQQVVATLPSYYLQHEA